MSILIRGMNMPTSCEKCRFCVNGFTDDAPMYECATQSYDNVSVLVEYSGKPFDFRPDWCPLLELPEKHGRLIDADELIRELASEHVGGLEAIKKYTNADTWTSGLHTAWRLIDDSPTVIEAEGREE